MKGIAKVPVGKKQATLFSLIQESIKLDSEEEKQFRKLVRDNPMYKEVKMLQSVKEVGIEEGIEQGRFQALEETAINMLRSGLANEQIAQFTGLDSRTIKEIAKKLKSGKTPDYKARR